MQYKIKQNKNNTYKIEMLAFFISLILKVLDIKGNCN